MGIELTLHLYYNVKHWRKCGTGTLMIGIENGIASLKDSSAISYNDINLPQDAVIPPLGLYAPKYKCMVT